VTELTLEKQKLLDTDGHILALGGPGSGKTYIALLKTDREAYKLKPRQRILFLSFARATIARVIEEAGRLVSGSAREVLEINTYHGFAWKLLRSHGYLLKASSMIRLLPPPEAASRLADIPLESRTSEKHRLFDEEGLLHFDLFAEMSAELLSKSQALSRIICDAYPIIILDEFQDTNSDEWRMIQALGRRSRLIALADVDQRIYEFRGADPRRIGEFIAAYAPTQFDFALENNRSNGTDIVTFGNDLLIEANKGKAYKDVTISRYLFYRGLSAHYTLKASIIQGIKRQLRSGDVGWSIAVLVPTKKLMLAVSDYLSGMDDRLPSIQHDVALDTEGPALAAVIIAGLLEGGITTAETAQRMILDLYTHIRGRKGGDVPTQSDLDLAGALGGYVASGLIRGRKRQEIVSESRRIALERENLQFSGDPSSDWNTIRKFLSDSSVDVIRQVAEDSKYLRLLHRGAPLRSRLGEIWRTTGGYVGAAPAVRNALLQEHFSASIKARQGVHVMTIHKSKGKEFNEVIIYEGSHQGRIMRANGEDRDISQARLALRVAVTRAMKRATILTPKNNVCPFL
jgi:DNA helicase-2/ATP-dependent DNA helicase PcrA